MTLAFRDSGVFDVCHVGCRIENEDVGRTGQSEEPQECNYGTGLVNEE